MSELDESVHGLSNGSGIQRRGRFRVPKPMNMLLAMSEARKRRAEAGPRPLLTRVSRRVFKK
jgi:hypothetical protein